YRALQRRARAVSERRRSERLLSGRAGSVVHWRRRDAGPGSRTGHAYGHALRRGPKRRGERTGFPRDSLRSERGAAPGLWGNAAVGAGDAGSAEDQGARGRLRRTRAVAAAVGITGRVRVPGDAGRCRLPRRNANLADLQPFG